MTHDRPDVVAIALTGGIGAGKSTALRFFAEAGACTLSADAVVHSLYSRSDVKKALTGYFGADILDSRGGLDRGRLAEAIRGDRERLLWLERLAHPLVREEITRFVAQAPPGCVIVVEVPLLFEAGMQEEFDVVVTIEAGAQERRNRSVHGFDEELFDELESLQASSERRVAGSDLAFVNDGDVEHLRAFVRDAYERARVLATGNAAEDRR